MRSIALQGLLCLGALAPLHAATITLYNGALNTSPSTQGFLFSSGGGTESLGGGGVTYSSLTNDAIQGGYTRLVTQNAVAGYTIRFDLQVIAEDHSNVNAQNNTGVDNIADRAGVSLILLNSGGTGIELGFWTDEIWAQNDGPVKADPVTAPTGTRFTHGEGAAFNTTALTRYDLSVVGSTYALYAGGNFSAPVLSGSLRNYSPEGLPYTLPNFLYLGDNTTSARGSLRLNLMEISDTAVPEPGTMGLMLAGIAVFAALRLKR
ncbi:MAG: PEP-CTERM sorting domain-containing protein [Bryobacterales bacterium]|nr:PEP-CTERM sorting domain-containing protein [Bryobacterales bacterium]